MKLGIAFLVLSYVLSQFYRAFLAVLAPQLGLDVGAGPEDLAVSSGMWFLVFALMQIPVGWALDTFGPRRTAGWLLGVAGGSGAAIFAMASAPWHLHVAMGLIGAGCAPVLMASFYIFGRMYPPAVFATLGGALIGVGTLGNLAGALPLAWAAESFGWRNCVWALTALTAFTALALFACVTDPPKAESEAQGSLMEVLKTKGMWLVLPMLFVGYAAAANIRGLWVGPYFTDVYGLSPVEVGVPTLIMALAMVGGAFAYGPLDRIFGTRKGVAMVGNLLGVACLVALWWAPAAGYWQSVLLIAAIGLLGHSYPLLMAHGRSFFPPHVLGRGVTFLNMFSIGGAGILQMVSKQVYAGAETAPATAPYVALFGFFALVTLAGCAIYAFSEDRTD